MIFKSKSPLGKQNIRVDQTMRQFNKMNNNSILYKPTKQPISPFSHTFAKAKHDKDISQRQKDTSTPFPLNRHVSQHFNLQCDQELQIFDKPKRQQSTQMQMQDNLTCDEMLQIPKQQHQWLKKTYTRVYTILQQYHMRYLNENKRANNLQEQNYRLRQEMRYYRLK